MWIRLSRRAPSRGNVVQLPLPRFVRPTVTPQRNCIPYEPRHAQVRSDTEEPTEKRPPLGAGTPMTSRDTLQRLVGLARYPSLIHGPAHWSRVRRFGALLAEKEQLPVAARACVEIFALLHDLAREDDGGGNQHAIDGSSYMDEVMPCVFGQLSLDQIETVRVAIRYHSDGMVARQANEKGLFDELDWPRDLLTRTVGCCWDADRLDLPRVGIHPVPELMSTAGWRDVFGLSLRIHDATRSDDDRFKNSYDPTMAARRRGD